MNAPLRRAGMVLMVLFGLLFLNLNWVQVYQADAYRGDEEHNRIRVEQREYDRPRGQIIVDGRAVASNLLTLDTLKYLRTYPDGALYAHAIGYRPVENAATDIERLENDILSGNADTFAVDRLLELFTGKGSRGGDVALSLRRAVQQAAYNGLLKNSSGTKIGAVVAIDPNTGAILALASTPSFDPNPLVSHDLDAANAAYAKLSADPNKPLLNRALSETFPPGSTFKVIVAAAALNSGLDPDSILKGGKSYTAPGTTTPIRNAPGVVCPDAITLRDALRVSCNTAFARLGTEQLGADRIKQAAQAFGFETTPLLELDQDNIMRAALSSTGPMAGPDGRIDQAMVAQSCIGQRDVRMTPLQGALLAAAIANNGVQMRPYLIETLLGPDLSVLGQAQPRQLRQPVSAAIAGDLRMMMDSVVSSGTGTGAALPGYEVGGKTGTAQNGTAADHGWFIGYARSKTGVPLVAVAVLLQNAGPGGSAAATEIGGEVMKAAIASRGTG